MKVGTKILDFVSGKHVWEYYQIYKKTQWYSAEEMKDFQIRKLRELLNHCFQNVPYYNSVIKEKQIDIESTDLLNELSKFPILTKEIIQEKYETFLPTNSSRIRGIKESQTGGTTGNILFKRNDSLTRSSIWGSYKRYEDWMGISGNYKTLILMGGHIKEKSLKNLIIDKGVKFLKNSISVDIYDTTDETIEKVINLLQTNSFSAIRSYPQFLFSIAKKLELRGLSFDVKVISTTAEPVLQIHRTLFKKIFNADVFDQYGCGEIGGIAYECEKHQGLHVAEERVIIETNEFNDLIITDLDNYAMPFIRYWNADQAIVSNDYCSCGRKSKLIKQILGRTCDYVTGRNGQFLHWAYFWHLIFDSNIAKNRNLRKFQIVQNSDSNLQIRLIADKLTVEEEAFFVTDMRNRLGELTIEFKYEREIENSKTGKYVPVINKLL
jgi:phenylacetate-CoA ligase